MSVRLAYSALLVPDYDEGIRFLCDGLGFRLIEDSDHGNGKRWVRVGGDGGGELLLAKARKPVETQALGRQFGDRVGLFLHTADFAESVTRIVAAGGTFEEEPRHEDNGTVAVFRDPWGNRWDLIEPR